MNHKKVIAMVFKEGGENGGPYISHKRIMESALAEKYDIVPIFFPAGRMGIFCPRLIRQVRRQIRLENPDVVQIPGLQLLGFHTLVAAMLEKKKTIVAIHGSSMESMSISKIKKQILKVLEDFTMRRATAIYTVSEYVESWPRIRKYASKCFGTIYNLPQEEISVDRDLRNELMLGETDFVVASTGRIVREKGYEDFVRVVKILREEEHIKFIVAGEGNYLDEMKQQLEEEIASKKVFLLGYRQDIDNVLAAADAFMILTLHETLCISLLEACRHGIPCVATNVGGIPEIVKQAQNGFLVDVHDCESAVQRLKELCDNPEMRRDMCFNAKRIFEDVFSPEAIVKKLDCMYRSVIDGQKK